MEFTTPEVERPMMVMPPQQAIVRVERRDDKEAGLHPLLRTPKIFADPDEQKLSSDLTGSPGLPGSVFSQPPPWSSDKVGKSGADSALSPITDLNWDARDSNRRSKDSKDSTKGDRNDSRTRRPIGAQDDSDSKFDAGRSSSVRDLFTAHVREKPKAMEIEREAAFQQLLNPNAESGARTPSALQPVVSATEFKPGGLGIPTIAVGGNSGLTPRGSDPTAAFNRQHERLRGPVMEDINKKYSSQPSPPAKTSTLDPRLPLPLNRQPAIHEFPTRKF